MSMSISTDMNTEYGLNAIGDYNQFLRGQAVFDMNADFNGFDKILERETDKISKTQTDGVGNFMDKVSSSFADGLNSVNNMRIQADKMQEDIALGGSTNIHDAMIAAEKADLSMKMAVQVRNRVIDAYTQITSMAL